MGQLQALPHTIVGSAPNKDNQAQKVLRGNQPQQWAKPKSIRAVCCVSLTRCLVLALQVCLFLGCRKFPRGHMQNVGGKKPYENVIYPASISSFFAR